MPIEGSRPWRFRLLLRFDSIAAMDAIRTIMRWMQLGQSPLPRMRNRSHRLGHRPDLAVARWRVSPYQSRVRLHSKDPSTNIASAKTCQNSIFAILCVLPLSSKIRSANRTAPGAALSCDPAYRVAARLTIRGRSVYLALRFRLIEDSLFWSA
jgi:hypothetical protein